MGDTTIYLLLDYTLLGKRVGEAATPLPFSSSSAAPSPPSEEPSFQFERPSHVLSADASLSELMSVILSQIILASPQYSQDTKKWNPDNLTILDISHHPAKVVSSAFRRYTETSGPNSMTLKSLGWFPSGKLVVLPAPSPSPSSVGGEDDREEDLLTRFLQSCAARGTPAMPAARAAATKHPEAETDAKTRNKRQRLLLLHHASKCTAGPGQCTVTPHCAKMKDVWQHIAKCKDSYCKVLYCMSSRFLLSHYRRCAPPCNICDPVKKIIHGRGITSVALEEGTQPVPPSPTLSMAGHLPQPKRQITERPPSSSKIPGEELFAPLPRAPSMAGYKRPRTEQPPHGDVIPKEGAQSAPPLPPPALARRKRPKTDRPPFSSLGPREGAESPSPAAAEYLLQLKRQRTERAPPSSTVPPPPYSASKPTPKDDSPDPKPPPFSEGYDADQETSENLSSPKSK